MKYGKPHPEPYLMGLEKAGVQANEAIVVENADVYKRQVLITTVAIVAYIAFCGCPEERSTAFSPR